MTTRDPRAVRPQKLAHIVLRTGDKFDAVSNWYEDVLQAEIVFKNDSSSFMTFDDEHHRLAIVKGPLRDRPADTVGLEHIAFTYATLADLLGTYERLKEKKILPILPINHGATTSLYYEDPDRNRVELQVDNFPTFAEFAQFMATGVMALNPIGVAFDPDEMLNKLRSGVPAASLQKLPHSDGVDPAVMERLNRN